MGVIGYLLSQWHSNKETSLPNSSKWAVIKYLVHRIFMNYTQEIGKNVAVKYHKIRQSQWNQYILLYLTHHVQS